MFSRSIAAPFGALTIAAKSEALLCRAVIGDARYAQSLQGDAFEIRLGFDIPRPDTRTYRAARLERGHYLGHHFGKPGTAALRRSVLELHIGDGASPRDYERLLWTYALKFVFTVQALKCDALHLKAVTISDGGLLTLLIGRGGSGKTTLANFLADTAGYQVLGNTHAYVRGQHAWAFNTWTRVRNRAEEVFVPANNAGAKARDGRLGRIIWVEACRNGSFTVRQMERSEAFSSLVFFASAVGTYDLKEDVADYASHHIDDQFADPLTKELRLTEALVAEVPVLRLSADIATEDSRKQVLALFGQARR